MGSLTAMSEVVLADRPKVLYDSPMLLLGERRKTSSAWGVRVLCEECRKACRARRVALRRWLGVRICGRQWDLFALRVTRWSV